MFTSVTVHKPDPQQKVILWDLAASLFCALFGAVYECFSHGVYSYWMIYAFVFPLALGALPLTLVAALSLPGPNCIVRSILHAGIAVLTVGSIVTGVLEIYGTTNPLTAGYWILGSILTVFGTILYLIPLLRKPKEVRA